MRSTIGCPTCSSKNGCKLNSEVALHLPGIENLTAPLVWAFPGIWVCLDCGFAAFALEDQPLKQVRQFCSNDELSGTDNLAPAV